MHKNSNTIRQTITLSFLVRTRCRGHNKCDPTSCVSLVTPSFVGFGITHWPSRTTSTDTLMFSPSPSASNIVPCAMIVSSVSNASIHGVPTYVELYVKYVHVKLVNTFSGLCLTSYKIKHVYRIVVEQCALISKVYFKLTFKSLDLVSPTFSSLFTSVTTSAALSGTESEATSSVSSS